MIRKTNAAGGWELLSYFRLVKEQKSTVLGPAPQPPVEWPSLWVLFSSAIKSLSPGVLPICSYPPHVQVPVTAKSVLHD
jgi:hypothetical protein